jgi:hypothetical protein
VNFAARQEAIRQNQGRPLDESQVNALRASQPQRPQMVRTVGQPANNSQPMGFGRNRPAPAGNATPATPANNPPVRNDRPPTATLPRPAQPAVRPAEPAVKTAEPAVKTAEPSRPAEPAARPAAETHPNAETPRGEHPAAEKKAPEKGKNNKKNDKTDKR